MIRFVRDFRLLPLVLIATICLFVLKTFGLVFEGGFLLHDFGSRNADESDITGAISGPQRTVEPGTVPPPKAKSWAQEMFNFPDVTGSIDETKAPPATPPKPAAGGPQEPPASPKGRVVALEGDKVESPAERAVLERLQERRKELDDRAHELDMQENLLKAAEKRVEGRVNELKELEARVNAAVQAKDEAETSRFKNLVTMYETMKPKDAAKIFDRLDRGVLLDVATQINPRQMSEIMAQMSADSAQRLTVDLAVRAANKDKPAELPKIEGKPIAN